MEKTHYTYLRDPLDSNRVITVARKLGSHFSQGTVIYFGLAVCRPKCYAKDGHKGDQHVKKLGRLIAEGRMNTQGMMVRVEGGERIMCTIARHILSMSATYKVPTFVTRIFQNYLDKKEDPTLIPTILSV